MKKLALLSLLTLSACASHCPCSEKKTTVIPTENVVQRNPKAFAEAYMAYLKEIGKVPLHKVSEIPHPFSADCKKTMNGAVVAKSSDEFVAQLSQAKKMYQLWKFEGIEIIPSQSTNSATIHYVISSQGLGRLEVLKVLRFAENGKVKEVLEVFAEAK
ncbi:hypothetical protein Bealeia1_00981 [Candidatus Bealeia paramacronuclearis]|uniref:Nuclear transport factor 2 family protein n=1 Tax=Candidatus Bealeia paramacronuclearis TaxID=1921001 RepID=A0ABZ2C5B6_9PROT|nr:hypothetical protein [Candidatus Bealeia paramacronuclearis]